MTPSTERLYLDDAYLGEFDAEVVDSVDGFCALTRTAFFPGGGGQPGDRGFFKTEGHTLPVAGTREDEQGLIWHEVGTLLPRGARVHGSLDWPYRHALMRHHGLMHVVNAVAREAYEGMITGVQIGPERSRIDLKLHDFSRDDLPDFEARVNEVITRELRVSALVITEEEFQNRPELVRTLNVLPPVVDGRVRIVTMEGFDSQACGGTHVHSTKEIGRARLAKFDNKGKDNKRFYWDLEAP